MVHPTSPSPPPTHRDLARLAGEAAAAEVHVAEAERWVREVSTTAFSPAEVAAPALCPDCGGAGEPVLYTVLGRPAARCGACGTWELVRGGAA